MQEISKLALSTKLLQMNRLKTPQEKQIEHYNKMNEIYKKDSLGMEWFFIIIIAGLLATALIENL